MLFIFAMYVKSVPTVTTRPAGSRNAKKSKPPINTDQAKAGAQSEEAIPDFLKVNPEGGEEIPDFLKVNPEGDGKPEVPPTEL